MNATDALRAAVGTLTREPAAVLPWYLFAAAVGTVARTPLLVGVAVSVAVLARQGRIERTLEALSAVEFDGLRPDGGGVAPVPGGGPTPGSGGTAPLVPAPDPETIAAIQEALAGLFTPTVVRILAVAVGVTVVVGLLARAVAAAGTLHTTYAHLVGSPPTASGVRGVGAHWRSFLGLQLLRVGASLAVVAAALGAFAVLGGAGGAGALAVLAVPVALATVAGLSVVALVLAFAGPAVVVDDVGALVAVRQSVRFILAKPAAAVTYVVGVLLLGALVAGLAIPFAVLGAPRVVGLATAVVVPPVLDGLKVALYAGGVRPGGRPGLRPLRALRIGLWSLGGFVRSHPAAILASATWFTATVGAGFAFAAGYATPIPLGEAGAGTTPAAGLDSLGVGGFLSIAVNNWLVAVGVSFGGLAFGLPTLAGLGLNGAFVGVVATLVERRAFLALVAPHGVIELPAIVIAGGLGLHLGRVGSDAVRGRRSPVSVGGQLADGGRVLLGLAVVFVIAAAVEAFVTPLVAARVLG